MKVTLLLLCFCFSTITYSIDVVINSVVLDSDMDASDCLNASLQPGYDLTVSNAIEDGLRIGGDLVGGLLRDANCNVLAWWYDGMVNGTNALNVTGTYDFNTTFPPDSRPFVISFHDLTAEVGLDEILSTPPSASLVFDPILSRADCSILPDLLKNTCPFAEATLVPTLGEWGLIVLAIMMMIFGVLSIYQRKIKV